eukprot:CAMPEP_0185853746 /NCGR_PEP_ID=MMETSP1354-20130828/20071_1 /TAXON_ID=708628 /ORGANISM="Erythrolobus madagascarensis, Strain CCMP3276" /LENGTH=149 /DNA_ID=CAMNT_0028555321 /DNA_START=40 /DNA_END=485 /DNA_ORIENTATION=-
MSSRPTLQLCVQSSVHDSSTLHRLRVQLDACSWLLAETVGLRLAAVVRSPGASSSGNRPKLSLAALTSTTPKGEETSGPQILALVLRARAGATGTALYEPQLQLLGSADALPTSGASAGIPLLSVSGMFYDIRRVSGDEIVSVLDAKVV